jgi:sulfoxide reductase heme-binding subunit YedZ
LYAIVGDGPRAQRLTIATAYVGLAFLAATLLIGPLNERRGRVNPVSTNVRRDIGIWAALAGILHTLVGFQVHMRGDIVRYFVPEADAGAVSGGAMAFLAANYTGLTATLLLVVLLTISNDFALRTLGSLRWKKVQRLNYLLFVLVIVHGFLYFAVDKASWRLVVPLALLALIVAQIRIGRRRIRAGTRHSDDVTDAPHDDRSLS